MLPRIPAMALATALVVLTVVGCGNEAPKYDPAVSYSPETLAQEFAFQYKAMKAAPGGGRSADENGPKERTGVAVKAEKPATKEMQVATLDSLIADVARKAGAIPGLSHAEACRKVAEAIGRDPSIAESDKKAVAEKLGRATD